MSAQSGSERHANARSVFADALGLYVGPGRRHSVGGISTATGISETQVRDYLAGRTTPSVANLGTLLGTVGADLANEWLAHHGLCGCRAIDGPTQPAMATLTEQLEAAHALSAAVQDGRIDHTERPGVVKELRESAHAELRLADDLEAGRAEAIDMTGRFTKRA